MGADQRIDWHAEAASALEWWRDAGVDMLVDDAPRDWLAPASGAVPAASPVADVTAAPPAAMPASLVDFLAWRAGPAAPDAGWRGISIAASGPPDAAIMLLADCPDRDDESDGVLIAGQPGRLLDRMLAAIGQSRATVHVAAICARRPVAGRMPRELEDELSAIARHHVGLVAPKRLLLLGNAASRAILGMETPQARGSLRQFNHNAGLTEVVASFHPRFLIEKPMAKAEAWKDLQLLAKGII